MQIKKVEHHLTEDEISQRIAAISEFCGWENIAPQTEKEIKKENFMRRQWNKLMDAWSK